MKNLLIIFAIIFLSVAGYNSLSADNLKSERDYAREVLNEIPNNLENMKLLEEAGEIKFIGSILVIKTPKIIYILNVPDYLLKTVSDGGREYESERQSEEDFILIWGEKPDSGRMSDEEILLKAKDCEANSDYYYAKLYYDSLDMREKAKEMAEKDAAQCEMHGDFGGAAVRYRALDMEDEAKAMYKLQAEKNEAEGNYFMLGNYYREAGMEDRAVEAFLKSAEYYEEEGSYVLAGMNYRSGHFEDKAKEMYTLAAQQAEAKGNYPQAIWFYLDAKAEDKAEEIKIKYNVPESLWKNYFAI